MMTYVCVKECNIYAEDCGDDDDAGDDGGGGQESHSTPCHPSGLSKHCCLFPPAFFTTCWTFTHSYSLDSNIPCSESSPGSIIALVILSSVLPSCFSYISFELNYNYYL